MSFSKHTNKVNVSSQGLGLANVSSQGSNVLSQGSNVSPQGSNPSPQNLTNGFPIECQNIIKTKGFSDKISIFCRYWNIDDCNNSPKALFIFGDNNIGKGCGGQAVIRYCNNSMGIPTKKYPTNRQDAFYTDTEFTENCRNIINSIKLIINKSIYYDEIVFPSDGFGTGLADLATKAPRTLKFMNKLIFDCFGVDYEGIKNNGLKNANISMNKNIRGDTK